MRNFFSNAIKAGFLVGALDIIAACLNAYIKNDIGPMQVLRGVASGAFDPKTFSNETLLAVLGLLIHFIIALSFTFFFFFLVAQIPSLVRYPLITGIVYGVFVWATMRFLILPYLSRIKSRPIVGKEAITNAAIAAGIIIVCIGIPLAYWARNAMKKK